MMHKLKSLPKFNKQFKKSSERDQKNIRKEIRKIVQNPLIGEPKKGILKGIRVYKWKMSNQLYLLGYEFIKREKTIYLYAIAIHEGFYRILERCKK